MRNGMVGGMAGWCWLGLAMAALGGCAMGKRPPGPVIEQGIHYRAADGNVSVRAVQPGGDFALFFDGADKAEVPVRVNAGDMVGFVRAADGRVEAVAGPFKMHVTPQVKEAVWKRLN